MQHRTMAKAFERYTEQVSKLFPFVGKSNFIEYEIDKTSKLVFVSITLPIDKDLGPRMMHLMPCHRINKRYYLVHHFMSDDVWTMGQQAWLELNTLRNLRDTVKIQVLQERITLRFREH